MGWKYLGSVWKRFGKCYTTGKSSRMDVNVYGHRLRCSNDLRSRMWDVIEAHVVGRVRGKFHQVVCKLCYEDDSVLSMNVGNCRFDGKRYRSFEPQ